MSARILARDLVPGDAFSARTPYGTVSHLITAVDVTDSRVTVYAHRFCPTPGSTELGVVDDWQREFKSDALIHFRGASPTEGNRPNDKGDRR